MPARCPSWFMRRGPRRPPSCASRPSDAYTRRALRRPFRVGPPRGARVTDIERRCQRGRHGFPAFRWSGVGVSSAGSVAVRQAVANARSDWCTRFPPQDHGSSSGAAAKIGVASLERVAHGQLAVPRALPGRHRPSRPDRRCSGSGGYSILVIAQADPASSRRFAMAGSSYPIWAAARGNRAA